MRKIKFRAKDLKNGEWVYGHYVARVLINGYVKHQIIGAHERTQVDEKTIGQFTGYYDSGGVELYDGDIVKAGKDVHTVKYEDMYAAFMVYAKTIIKRGLAASELTYLGDVVGIEKSTVIGNIHDNPELINP